MISSYLLLAGLLVASVVQTFAQTNPKKPVTDLVQAERNFAQTAKAKGIRDAFVQFLADDGIIFTPLPTPGKKYHQENPNPSAGLLSWEAIWADVSAAGDLGYTTGPFEFRLKPTDEKPAGTGHYVSVWRKTAAGNWQVVVDIGINHPPLTQPTALQTAPAPKSNKVSQNQNNAVAKQAEAQLLVAEKSFSKMAQSQGTQAAYTAFLAPTSRLYRDQNAPYIGKAKALAALADDKTTFTAEPAFAAAAASGDLGYTYGTNQTSGKQSAQAVFTRIWQKQPDSSWLIILDVTKLLPPAKKE